VYVKREVSLLVQFKIFL